MKQQLRKQLYRFIQNGGLTVIFSGFILLILAIFLLLIKDRSIENLIDLTIFSSIVVAMVLNSFSGVCGKWLMNRLEDTVKLTWDYERLMSKYQVNLYWYSNNKAVAENYVVWKKVKKRTVERVYFPVERCFWLTGCQVEIQDSNRMYQIPNEIKEHFDEIFSAHSTSNVYNQLSIRVDGWMREGNVFRIYTSRTTYYSSLVTNRAMDYPWSNGLTVRDTLEYGPFLHELSDSKLSNHLGLNGFVMSADGYIPFIKRSNRLSIGKNTYGSSVSVTLKVKYALDHQKIFNTEGLVNAILLSIRDELKIPLERLEKFRCSKNLIAAYRDLVEGGKPQIVFWLKSRWNKEQIEKNFSWWLIQNKKNGKFLLEDGSLFLWIHKNELPLLCLDQDMMIYHGKTYTMTHSTAASLAMFVEYLIHLP